MREKRPVRAEGLTPATHPVPAPPWCRLRAERGGVLAVRQRGRFSPRRAAPAPSPPACRELCARGARSLGHPARRAWWPPPPPAHLAPPAPGRARRWAPPGGHSEHWAESAPSRLRARSGRANAARDQPGPDPGCVRANARGEGKEGASTAGKHYRSCWKHCLVSVTLWTQHFCQLTNI